MKISIKIIATVVLAGASTALSGCSIFGGISNAVYTDLQDPVISPQMAYAVQSHYVKGTPQANNFNIQSGYRGTQGVDYHALATHLMANANASSNQKIALGTQMIRASDEACNTYLLQISANEKFTRTGLGLLSLGLTSTAGVLTQGSTTKILSNVATFSQSAETELGAELLGGKGSIELIDAVHYGRDAKRQVLKAHLFGKAKTDKEAAVAQSFPAFYLEYGEYHAGCGVTYAHQVIHDLLKKPSG